MDNKFFKAAAEAHHKAIGSIGSKLVTPAAEYEAVSAAFGRTVASVPMATLWMSTARWQASPKICSRR